MKYELPGLDSFPIFRFFDNFPDSFNVNFLYAGLLQPAWTVEGGGLKPDIRYRPQKAKMIDITTEVFMHKQSAFQRNMRRVRNSECILLMLDRVYEQCRA